MVGDPIGDMLTRIRNAGAVGHRTVTVPYSKLKHEIAKVLQQAGYIDSVEKKGRKIIKRLEIALKYRGDTHRITAAQRVSKPSRRMYVGVKDIRPVRHGHGIMVLSTPKGILTGEEAKKEHVGGEVLFTIW